MSLLQETDRAATAKWLRSLSHTAQVFQIVGLLGFGVTFYLERKYLHAGALDTFALGWFVVLLQGCLLSQVLKGGRVLVARIARIEAAIEKP